MEIGRIELGPRGLQISFPNTPAGQYIYLASPYSNGDKTSQAARADNVFKSMEAAHVLMDMGLTVFNPLLSHFHNIQHPRPTEYWYKWCLAWLSRCDALVYLPGESHGVQLEIEYAEKVGIPVYKYEEVVNNGQI